MSGNLKFARYIPTYIVLLSFQATTQDSHILVQWETGVEIDNAGFHLWRSASKDGSYQRVSGFLISSQGGPSFGAKYSYHDFDVVPENTCWYKLEDIQHDGKSTFHGPISSK